MLLGDGQGGTVDPLVNLFPFLRLEGVEPFPGVTHPRNTSGVEGKGLGTPPHPCMCLQGLWGTGGLSPGVWPHSSKALSIFCMPGGELNALQKSAHSVFSTTLLSLVHALVPFPHH